MSEEEDGGGGVAAEAGGAQQQGRAAPAGIGEHFPGGGIIERAGRRDAGDEEGQHAFGEAAGEQVAVDAAGGVKAAGEPDGAGFERGAFVIVGDERARRFLDRGVDRGDPVLLDDIVAQRRGDHPDQFVLELGGQLDLAHVGLLEAVEAAAAGDDQLHRLGGDLLVGIADQLEQIVLAALAPGVRLPEAVLFDPADEDVAEIGVAQHAGALENRQSDRHAGGGERGVERVMGLEAGGEAGAELVLDALNEAGQQRRGGEPLPLGQSGLIGEQKVGRGDGKTLPRRGQQQARSIALVSSTVRSAFRHDFP